jgi:peptidoglycan/xylan/chitin deacetylase (PgdA/CDA1 family)
VPGLVIEQRPWLAEDILRRGHEIAHHSWSHRWIVSLTPEEEREEMEKGIEIIERCLVASLPAIARPRPSSAPSR